MGYTPIYGPFEWEDDGKGSEKPLDFEVSDVQTDPFFGFIGIHTLGNRIVITHLPSVSIEHM